MRRFLATFPALAAVIVVGLSAASSSPSQTPLGAAPSGMAPTNDLPNPYQTITDWAKLPEGRTWGATSAVAIDRDGISVWVAERCGANSCVGSTLPPVLHFDANGHLIKAFGEGLMLAPHGIYVDRDDNIWVIDCACTGGGRGRATPVGAAPAPVPTPPPLAKGHQIFKFRPDGTLLLTMGTAGGAREPDFFFQPNNIVIAADGSMFVAEGHSSATGSTARVMKFSSDGRLIRSFGHLGTGPDAFDQPHALAIDSRGRLFVGDRDNNRIEIFDQNFTLLDTWYQFSRPSGIFIDADDVIYVADSESESVSRNNGMHGHEGWKRGIRIGSAKDGSIKYFIPDPVDTATNTSDAEGVTADMHGVVYGAEVGPKALKRYVKR